MIGGDVTAARVAAAGEMEMMEVDMEEEEPPSKSE